ncbi:MAG: FAD-dependent thymidylate synthase, partial [Candidatus Diapherotrites archaeon]|nr:FAD-dependent thymidylate synthase [Candidatus Diapherotrites archaeon]
GIRREEARGVLGLGTPTHMLAVMSVESVSGMLKWGGDHPEIQEFLKKLKEEVLKSDVGDILRATEGAPTMGGPFPHPFHRESFEAGALEVVDSFWNGSFEGVEAMERAIEEIRERPARDWKDLVENTVKLSKIAYKHATEFGALFRVKMALTTFNEFKRHRTVRMRVEGIYPAMERGEFYVYPSVKNHPEAMRLYSWVIEEFKKLEAHEYERVYALPQSVKVGVEFLLEFHQLTAPSLFYRMRSCDRAEVSMKQLVRQIPFLLKKLSPYGEKLFRVMTTHLNGSRVPLPKCVIGGCPEPEFCPLVKGINPNYDEGLHRRIKKGRKEVFG